MCSETLEPSILYFSLFVGIVALKTGLIQTKIIFGITNLGAFEVEETFGFCSKVQRGLLKVENVLRGRHQMKEAKTTVMKGSWLDEEDVDWKHVGSNLGAGKVFHSRNLH